MIFGLAVIDGIALGAYFLLQILHGFLMSLGHRTLMVTENGDGTIGPIIGEQFLGNRCAVIS